MIDGHAPVESFDEIDSTILEARRRAERGETTPVWIIAKHQTAGRGRRGRVWTSLEGNLFATHLFTTTQPPARIALVGFSTAIALADAIDAHIGPGRTTLKWPNDVLIDGAKASGLMLDSGTLAQGVTWVALGFGVNLAAAPQGLDQPTISLRDVLPPDAPTPEPLAFLAQVRARLASLDAQHEAHGFEPIRQAWLERAHGFGRVARVAQGETMLEGRVAGLSARGELELDTESGRRRIAAGDVYFTEAV